MSKSSLCPRCQQPLPPEERGGVYLPPKKVKVFDAIKKNPGISINELIVKCYDGEASQNTVRVTICQINDLLASTDLRISGDGNGKRGCYEVIETKKRRLLARQPAPSSSHHQSKASRS